MKLMSDIVTVLKKVATTTWGVLHIVNLGAKVNFAKTRSTALMTSSMLPKIIRQYLLVDVDIFDVLLGEALNNTKT